MSYTLINRTVLTSNTASVILSSIPQTYKNLELHISAQADVKRMIRLEINESYANENTKGRSDDGSTGVGQHVNSSGYMGESDALQGIETSGVWGGAIIQIPDYTNTNAHKEYLFNSGSTKGMFGVGMRKTTSAVTSLKLVLNGADQFITGSTFTLWGVS